MKNQHKKIKILYWTPFFLPDIGGIEVRVAKVLPILQQRNYEFIVVTSHGKYKLTDETTYDGVPVYRFKFRESLKNGKLGLMLKIRQQITELKKSFKPDLVHIYLSSPNVYFHLSTRLAHPSPTIASVQQNLSYFGLKGGPNTLLGQTLNMADWVTAVSKATLADIYKLPPDIKSRSSVIYNGLDFTYLNPEPLSFDVPRILCIGRLIYQKGFDLAISAFNLLLDHFPNAFLIIAGNGPIRPDLEKQAATLGLTKSVEFTGRINPDMVPALLNTATMVVMPSRTEGFPMVALEASQMARPVIASPVGGLPEAVLHQETGLIIENENSQALFKAMAYLLRNPHIAAQMGQKGRLRTLKMFSMENYITAYDQLYRKLASSKGQTQSIQKECSC